jgi:hypothetical protein
LMVPAVGSPKTPRRTTPSTLAATLESWQLPAKGGTQQLLEVVGLAYISVAGYAVFKAFEARLVRKSLTRPAHSTDANQPMYSPHVVRWPTDDAASKRHIACECPRCVSKAAHQADM